MIRSKWILIGLVALVLVIVPISWWLVSPLFIDNEVDEMFPFALPAIEEIAQMADGDKMALLDEVMAQVNDPAVMDTMSNDDKAEVEERVRLLSAAMPDKPMDDTMPTPIADEWQVVATGSFQDADDFHRGSGQATIYQQGDTRILRFEEFSVTNGPDLHVLLVENIDATSAAEMGAFVDLGALKGNIGNQNYEIPADVDQSQYRGVMIYCQPFHVVFATAAFDE